MGKVTIAAVGMFFGLVLFSWLFYFRSDIREWWITRPVRRQWKRDAVREREAELTRLRDELASKYLPPQNSPPTVKR